MDKVRLRTGLRSLLAIAICAIAFQGCGTAGQLEFKPTSAGKADEILWVMNDGFWSDTIGGTVKHTFMRSYGILPQAEPEYFVREKNFNQFNNDIIKKYRTIVICASRDSDVQYAFAREMIDDAGVDYENIVFLRNVWAQPQYVIVITADTRDELHDVLRNRSAEVIDYIRKSEDERIRIMLYENGNNDEATALVTGKYGFRMDIPVEYYIAVDNPDFTWLRRESVFLSSNILFYKRQLDAEEMAGGVDWQLFARNVRNYLGQSYISSDVEGSYMEIEDRFALVDQGSREFLEQECVETQGLWRMEKDFMGGPFRNLAWFDEATSTYYMIDMFVHAPKEGKKKFMRQLDYILDRTRLPEQE
jgi:hypothetical protein